MNIGKNNLYLDLFFGKWSTRTKVLNNNGPEAEFHYGDKLVIDAASNAKFMSIITCLAPHLTPHHAPHTPANASPIQHTSYRATTVTTPRTLHRTLSAISPN